MASIVGICNRALQKLGAERIIALTQDSVPARAANAAFETVRDAELRAHSWSFAIKRASLASTTAPAFGYSYAFQLPSDCLRLLPPDHNEGTYMQDWKLEGRLILTNDTAPLQIRYVARITDPNQYDTLFNESLACKLAMEMCEELTQSNSKKQLIAEEYKAAIREARRINAFENVPAEQQTDSWITARL